MGRDRPRRGGVHRPRRAHESEPRAPGTAVVPRHLHPSRSHGHARDRQRYRTSLGPCVDPTQRPGAGSMLLRGRIHASRRRRRRLPAGYRPRYPAARIGRAVGRTSQYRTRQRPATASPATAARSASPSPSCRGTAGAAALGTTPARVADLAHAPPGVRCFVVSRVSHRAVRWYHFHSVCRRHRRTVLRSISSSPTIPGIDQPALAQRSISSRRLRPTIPTPSEHPLLGLDQSGCRPRPAPPRSTAGSRCWPSRSPKWSLSTPHLDSRGGRSQRFALLPSVISDPGHPHQAFEPQPPPPGTNPPTRAVARSKRCVPLPPPDGPRLHRRPSGRARPHETVNTRRCGSARVRFQKRWYNTMRHSATRSATCRRGVGSC